MPTAIHIASLIERCSFLQYAGCCGIVGIRVGEPGIELGQRREHRRRAVEHPAHLAAPLDGDDLARLDLADVDLDRRAGGLGALADGQNDMTKGPPRRPRRCRPPRRSAPIRKRRFLRRPGRVDGLSSSVRHPRIQEGEQSGLRRRGRGVAISSAPAATAVPAAREVSLQNRRLYGIWPSAGSLRRREMPWKRCADQGLARHASRGRPRSPPDPAACRQLHGRVWAPAAARDLYFRPHAPQILAALRPGLHASCLALLFVVATLRPDLAAAH